MTRVLNAERREPVSGTTRSVVVFLHGYGANGADLLGLADPLSEHLPDTLFVAPMRPKPAPVRRWGSSGSRFRGSTDRPKRNRCAAW